jgi:hypothetical protein
VLADFAGILQFRAPGELGGVYFSVRSTLTTPQPPSANSFLSFAPLALPLALASQVNMVLALTACFVSTYIYYEGVEEEPAIKEKTAWAVVGGLVGAWLLSFGAFLALIDPAYIKSFFSRKTGSDWSKSYFLDNDEDRIKMFIHGQNRLLWKDIRGDVKAYTLANWERWEADEPEWFNDNFKGSVDDDMVPDERLSGMGGVGRMRTGMTSGRATGGNLGGILDSPPPPVRGHPGRVVPEPADVT